MSLRGERVLWIEPLRRIQLLDFFRSLDAALDEHKGKGTPVGDPVYQKIFEQLAGDVAMVGFGKDEIPFVANECGQLSTYKRLEQLMTKQNQPQESAAMNLLNDQLNKLMQVRSLDAQHPDFTIWHDTVKDLFQRFLRPDSPHFNRFKNLSFKGPPVMRLDFPSSRHRYGITGEEAHSAEDAAKFLRDCGIAEGCIKGAMDTIRNFGIHSEGVDGRNVPQKGGGVQQTFHGPVTFHSQAIATDKAVQNIGNMGSEGASLKEIAALLRESMELRGREVQEGLKAVEEIAAEIQKPKERRNWRSLIDGGEKLLGIATKATDLTVRLAPYLAHITALVHEASSKLGG